MGDYKLLFARSARKELEALTEPEVSQIFKRIESLAKTPRPRGCLKIKGSRILWRIRIGEYRVIYAIDDVAEMVDIIAVRHRSEAYR